MADRIGRPVGGMAPHSDAVSDGAWDDHAAARRREFTRGPRGHPGAWQQPSTSLRRGVGAPLCHAPAAGQVARVALSWTPAMTGRISWP